MTITRKPPAPPKPKPVEPPAREMSDEAFEHVSGGALDGTRAGAGRPGKGREKGKGYVMGNKRQITHMITGALLDQVDAEAERCGEARATVINRYIREGLARDGV